MPTIHDVAREAGVSLTTVSRSFRSPHLLNQETHERVRTAADRLGYTDRQAKRLRDKTPRVVLSSMRTAPIGFLFVSTLGFEHAGANLFYAPVLTGAQSAAADLGVPLFVQTITGDKLQEQVLLMREQQRVESILLVGSVGERVLMPLTDWAQDILLVDNAISSPHFETIVSHGFQGGRLAAQHLLELGHRRVVCITGSGANTFQDRLHGFISALWDAGLPPSLQDILPNTYEDNACLNALRAYFDKTTLLPTAFFAVNDRHALLLLQVCQERGIRVPEDISVIGFDNTLEGQYATPPITTIEVDKERMGYYAVQLLHSRRSSSWTGKGLAHHLPVSLVVRQSCQDIFV
jgi:DNA-binding LacI/PurR family transcriptional regulator